ncbi:MAG TPA: hypothetical protein PKJ19_10185 [Flavobacteriales bacterium]|nr:hypothetical protein [Flavobacteriales bacterium]
MNLDEIIEAFDRMLAAADGLILKNTERAALDALALVDVRITERGVNATGGAFEDYTPSYKKKKQAVGRYRGHVDFTLSGQMLASTTTGFERIGPTEKSVRAGRAKVSFDGRDEVTRKKLKGNEAKRPGFLQPSREEVEMVQRAANVNMERDLAALV